MSKQVTIRLSEDQARRVWLSADGVLDAGACEGGLDEEEREALNSLCSQILKQLPPKRHAIRNLEESE